MEQKERDPLSIVREVRISLANWLDSTRKLPDPTAQPAGTVQRIAAEIHLVNVVLRETPPGIAETAEWRREIDAYTATLRELRARLNNFELTLRIRRNQLRDAGSNLTVARYWSDLAKHIG
jgi:hypothetical protein